MKKTLFISFLLLFSMLPLRLFAASSREYQPISETEKQHYRRIDKNVWPDDVRNGLEKHKSSFVGWVGIVEQYMTDFTNPEYNAIGFYAKHHYYEQ